MATPPLPRRAAGESQTYLWAAFAVGFFLQFNPVPLAWHIPVPRFSQFAMLPCIAFLVHRMLSRTNLLSPLLYCALMLLFACIHVAVAGTSLMFGGGNTDLAITVSYVLYLIGGVGLYILLTQRSATAWFCWGLLIGALLSLVVFVMEANGMSGLAKLLGLTQSNQTIQKIGVSDGFSRLTGMWGHANEVGHVLAIAAPAAGYLYVARRERMALLVLAIVTGACFYFTANRGGVIAVLVTCIVMLFARKEVVAVKRRSILIMLAALAVISYALYFMPSPDFIYARFSDESGATKNASGRVETTLAGIELALQHPFGIGDTDWRAALQARTGFSTPHDGFISMAYEMGLPFVLMVMVAMAIVSFAGFRQPRTFSLDIFLMLAAVQMMISFLFEELSYVDPFVMLVSLILARVYSGAVSTVTRRGARGTAPSRRQVDLQAQPATP